LSIGVSFESATDLARLGGDFYDVLDLGDTGVLILVGDACGNGVRAAATAARARYAMEAHASLSSDPASFMGMTNQSLLRLLPPEHYVTAVACLVDRRSRCLTTCLAGHPSPLRLSAETEAGAPGAQAGTPGTEVDAPPNAPLGLFADLRYEEKTERLAQGDILLIYTDGVTDSRRGNALFGSEGVVRILESLHHQTPEADIHPEDIARNVRSAAAGFHDPALPGDDRLVMAIRVDGAGEE
jgi:serine phosphatase RsbU (regulator of sigma subunit)